MKTPPTKVSDASATTTKGDVTDQKEQQKKEARAPQKPATEAPKAPPPQSSKPLWDKPHSNG